MRVHGEELHFGGRRVPGFGLGTPVEEWVAMRDRLWEVDRLIGSGRGGQAAVDEAANLRRRMNAGLGAPPEVRVAAHASPARTPVHASPWFVAAVTGVASTVAGWVMEEIAHRTFRRGRRR